MSQSFPVRKSSQATRAPPAPSDAIALAIRAKAPVFAEDRVFGFWDWLAIPEGTRAKRIGLLHGSGNVVVILLFALSWLIRHNTFEHRPSVIAFVLSLLGLGLALFTGWLGGELVDRLGVGVDPGANLDASSSLSGRPASQP